ncbi:MAG: Rieske (2Fe-2S) protein [Anaerolineae bacterium]|nr:Rieske (2Fe-2S) protein [Anaerolineae bacterium]
MNLANLVTAIPIEPDLRWAILGPEAEAFAAKLALGSEEILPGADFMNPKLQGLVLAGALSAEMEATTWLDQLLAALPERARLIVIEWQGDGPLDVGPELERRFKRGKLCRHLRQAGFSQIEVLVNHPLYYIAQATHQAPESPPHAGEFVPVATIAELPKNGMKLVEVFGRAIIVANTGREIVAFAQACPHAGTSLLRGKLKGRMIICPLHYYMWNISSGEPIEPADEDILPLYPVRVDSTTGVIQVALSL